MRLRDLLHRWARGEVDERMVKQWAEEVLTGSAQTGELSRDDPRSIPREVLSHLEILDQQLVLPEDIPEILIFLETPEGGEAEAWSRWEDYWNGIDYAQRIERLKGRTSYSSFPSGHQER